MVSLKRNPDSNHNPAHRLCVFKSSQVTKCSTHKRHSDICVMNREQGADEWPSINLEFGRGIEVMTSRCCFAQIRQLLMHRKSININSIINVVDEEYDSRGLLSHSPHHKWQQQRSIHRELVYPSVGYCSILPYNFLANNSSTKEKQLHSLYAQVSVCARIR